MATDEDRPLHCGQPMVPIVYGMPGHELIEPYERGDIELGGCCISDDDPAFRCRVCGATSGRVDHWGEHVEDGDW